MGYKIDKIEKLEIRDRETGKTICEIEPPIGYYTEETPVADNSSVKPAFPKETIVFSATITAPPRPNIMMIISSGDPHFNNKTIMYFYRPKYYNWFQRLICKMFFGITIKQGDELKREFI